MEATGVSFAEQQMRRGRYYDQPPFPFVPGYDLVGTVVSTGDDVEPELAGTRVAALVKVGGWASHVLVDAADVVPVPDGTTAADAETVLVNGITAWQMLHRKARLRTGKTVLVHGANGGVGSVLVQLAHRHAYFFNIWAGSELTKKRFRARLRADLTQVFAALRAGDITPQIAIQLPLARIAEALRLAESGTVAGKIVLHP